MIIYERIQKSVTETKKVCVCVVIKKQTKNKQISG